MVFEVQAKPEIDKKHLISVHLDPDTFAKVCGLAAQSNISRAELLKQMIKHCFGNGKDTTTGKQ